ncbi:uncharacterized protein LOC5511879 isoform X2 [Nematostella vectensis]|uniref:uncharacterized protein LOC5511879 isoform X2 n=1 Tax=Nematostella vectensis TaxID=45351 RepID=UPI00138FEA7D|nr:uncharacterized protein LOC5511879 isoform X2 [Nematostella vectensis]
MSREARWSLMIYIRHRRRRLVIVLTTLLFAIIILKILFTETRDQRVVDFLRDWCRVRRARVDWEQVLKPCKGRTTWGAKHDRWDSSQETDPGASYILLWDIHPAGEFTRFSIQSQTTAGRPKTIGGDSWRVQINGPSSVAGTVFDHANGTYEVLLLVTVPGLYSVDAVLEYSLCNGYTDPPADWFIIGSAQGKGQKEGVLGTERPYLLKKLWGGQPITVTIPPAPDNRTLLSEIMSRSDHHDLSCGIQCRLLWDGFGTWHNVNGKLLWKPYVPRDDKPFISLLSVPARLYKSSILWIYGDSVSEQFFSGIRKHPLCTRVFRWCGHTYNWVYKLRGNFSISKSQDDDKDFDDVRILNEIDDVISLDIFDRDSTILLNAGLHYLESTNFTNYQRLIDGIVLLFKRAKDEPRDLIPGASRPFPGHMIWKTTTSLNKHKLDGKHLQSRRFLTSQRVLLFNAYASSAMCHAGFDVLDVYPLTDSYPLGTGTPERPKDAVHYEHFVFDSVERLLLDHFARLPRKN